MQKNGKSQGNVEGLLKLRDAALQLMAEVRVSIGGQRLAAIITARSAREMQLKRGQTAAALIKATDVMLLRV